jgi:nucleotide-binding universal stress UspA family protein
MAGEIVVGYDGQDGSRAALSEAVRLASELSTPLVICFAYEVDPAGGEVKDLADVLREHGTKQLAEAARRAQDAGCVTETVMLRGPIAQSIADLADERDARMIVVGTNSERPLKAAIVGSTPHNLLYLSYKPVLVIPIPEDREDASA